MRPLTFNHLEHEFLYIHINYYIFYAYRQAYALNTHFYIINVIFMIVSIYVKFNSLMAQLGDGIFFFSKA